jgi:hypothetical protein
MKGCPRPDAAWGFCSYITSFFQQSQLFPQLVTWQADNNEFICFFFTKPPWGDMEKHLFCGKSSD